MLSKQRTNANDCMYSQAVFPYDIKHKLNSRFYYLILSDMHLQLLIILRLCSVIVAFSGYITKAHLFKYIENFTTKFENFQIKKLNIFHLSPRNIHCRYL